MNAGNRVKDCSAGYLFCFIVLGWLSCSGCVALAIDNPDAPDYVGDFKNRARTYEHNIQHRVDTTQGYRQAYTEYENFLAEELKIAYEQLMTYLDNDARAHLVNSQREWHEYRDAAFEFIAVNWTTKDFGSASVISRGDYRTTIIKDRVILLLYYLQNY